MRREHFDKAKFRDLVRRTFGSDPVPTMVRKSALSRSSLFRWMSMKMEDYPSARSWETLAGLFSLYGITIRREDFFEEMPHVGRGAAVAEGMTEDERKDRLIAELIAENKRLNRLLKERTETLHQWKVDFMTQRNLLKQRNKKIRELKKPE
jgi:hypothetical protein